MDSRIRKFVAQIINSLPDMSPEAMDFWINNGSDLPELKEILSTLNSPETIFSAKNAVANRTRCEYGEINS